MTEQKISQTISYIRPGRTKNPDGTIRPTDLRCTYHLDIPKDLYKKEFETQTDAEKEQLVLDLLTNGATFADMNDEVIPAYELHDETGTLFHWQFYKENKIAYAVTQLNKNKDDILCTTFSANPKLHPVALQAIVGACHKRDSENSKLRPAI